MRRSTKSKIAAKDVKKLDIEKFYRRVDFEPGVQGTEAWYEHACDHLQYKHHLRLQNLENQFNRFMKAGDPKTKLQKKLDKLKQMEEKIKEELQALEG